MSKVLPQTPERLVHNGVALVTDRSAAGTGVTFCFSERIGGVSPSPYASLNMGGSTDDDPANVRENRRRLLAALDAEDLLDAIVRPGQVHGCDVARITDAAAPVPEWVRTSCDAVACTVPNVVPLLVFADCVPVVIVTRGGFAVAHSGWRGTYGEISKAAALALMEETGAAPGELAAYIGPHIAASSYEVSPELADQFVARFGDAVIPTPRHLDLSAAIRASLAAVGVPDERVVDCDLDTYELTDRFFSHRAEHGRTGRHGALAFMRSEACTSGPGDGESRVVAADAMGAAVWRGEHR